MSIFHYFFDILQNKKYIHTSVAEFDGNTGVFFFGHTFAKAKVCMFL